MEDPGRRSPVVWALIVLNAGILLVVEAMGGSTDVRVMFRAGAQPTPLPPDQLWRMFTSMFLHFGMFHLLLNMWALWLFGSLFEQLLGKLRFVALYVASGLAGSAASAVFTAPGTLSAGASGAIFGLFGGFAVLGVRLRHTRQGRAWMQNALLLIGLNVVLGLSVPQIGLEAHLGGMVGGALVVAVQAAGAQLGGPPPDQPPDLPAHQAPATRRRWSGLVTAVLVAAASVAVAAAGIRA